MSEHLEGLPLIPPHMHDSIVLWIERGEPRPDLMGRFLHALLSNDLMEAFAYADEMNTLGMKGWASYLYNYAPSPCFGSPEKVRAWYERHHPAKATDHGKV